MATKVAVQTAQLDTLAQSISDAYKAVYGSGSLLLDICRDLQKLYRGADVPESHAEYVTDATARLIGWTDESVGPRKSEVRNKIIGVYPAMLEALPKAIEKKSAIKWADGIKIGTLLKNGKTATQAVTEWAKKRKPVDADKVEVAAAKERAGRHVKSILRFTQLAPKFRAELRTLCEEHGIVVK